MKQVNYKKLILPNIPYVFIALLATKLGQAARFAPGTDFFSKALHIMDGLNLAFESILPSFHPVDLMVGIAAGVILKLVVYFKGKNAKKFRKNLEYGSAHWGTREDIAPFVDPVFENSVILTQTESLMMNFTNDEMNLMCIYDAGTRTGLMKALSDMKAELGKDETELLELTDSTLKKLSSMTNEDYDKLELYPDFDE